MDAQEKDDEAPAKADVPGPRSSRAERKSGRRRRFVRGNRRRQSWLWRRLAGADSRPVRQASKVIAGQLSALAAPVMPPPETFAAVFAPCAHCHEIGQGARTMTGPPLTGIIGRKAASTPHYPYSQAFVTAASPGTRRRLLALSPNPQAVVPGTRMIFAGLPQKEIGALVSFIETVRQGDAGGGQTSQQDPSQTSAPGSNDDDAVKTLPSSTLAIGGPFTLVDTQGQRRSRRAISSASPARSSSATPIVPTSARRRSWI